MITLLKLLPILTHSYVISVAAGVMTVTMDGYELFTGPVSLPPVAYLGFTASTGGKEEAVTFSNLTRHDQCAAMRNNTGTFRLSEYKLRRQMPGKNNFRVGKSLPNAAGEINMRSMAVFFALLLLARNSEGEELACLRRVRRYSLRSAQPLSSQLRGLAQRPDRSTLCLQAVGASSVAKWHILVLILLSMC